MSKKIKPIQIETMTETEPVLTVSVESEALPANTLTVEPEVLFTPEPVLDDAPAPELTQEPPVLLVGIINYRCDVLVDPCVLELLPTHEATEVNGAIYLLDGSPLLGYVFTCYGLDRYTRGGYTLSTLDGNPRNCLVTNITAKPNE